MAAEPIKAEHVQCSNEEYHGDHSHVSNSMKEVFRDSRATYCGRFINGSIFAPEATDAGLVGTVTHCMALEPDEYAARFMVAPDVDKRKKEGKALYAEFEAASEGRTILTAPQYALARRMSDALRAHPIGKELLQTDGSVEFTIHWNDGIPRKCRLDKIASGSELIVDIKTANDPSPNGFARACASFGYHRQAEWYGDGYRAYFGDEARHVFLVVGKDIPHEVFCYELDQKSRDLGARQNRMAIEQMAECYRSGNWESPLHRQVTELGLPRWAFFNEYDLED